MKREAFEAAALELLAANGEMDSDALRAAVSQKAGEEINRDTFSTKMKYLENKEVTLRVGPALTPQHHAEIKGRKARYYSLSERGHRRLSVHAAS